MMNILSYVDSLKLCHVIKYFTELNQMFGQADMTFPLSSRSRAIEWQNKILLNYNHTWIKLIQACTMTSKPIKLSPE